MGRTPPGMREPDLDLVRPGACVPRVFRHSPVVVQVRPDGIPAPELAANPVDAGLHVELVLERTENAIPDEENSNVILVQVNIVLRVVDAVIRRRLHPVIQEPEPPDVPCVRPELVEKLRHAYQQKYRERYAAQRERQIENPARERSGCGLPQSCRQVELLALVMHDVGGPEQPYGVSQAVVPVVAEIVKYKGEDEGTPMPGRHAD